jgi:hypothetical protein
MSIKGDYLRDISGKLEEKGEGTCESRAPR